MNIKAKILFSLMGIMFMGASVFAHVHPDQKGNAKGNNDIKVRSDCAPATMSIDLAINNVRARLLNGGDVWWDLEDGRYIVPQVDPTLGVPGVSSIFAGAVWLGGFDDAENLKIAAQTYRNENRNDFWPGPLSDVGTTGADTCRQWDEFFRVYGSDIRNHITKVKEAEAAGLDIDCDDVPEDLKRYPASGNPHFVEFYGFNLPFDIQGLGSFFDYNGDDLYDPCDGDYPAIDVRGCPLEDNFPDEMIFWIYNDAGNSHTNTEGQPIRMEVQVQAFAYATNDEINDMTFYRYKLINRALKAIDSTFFGMWVDPDLGCFTDDYIGCNIDRSLMYVYNEDELDGTTGCDCPNGANPVPTYCDEVPVLGVDYFRGPRGPVEFTGTVDVKALQAREILVAIYDTLEIINDSIWTIRGDTLGELGMSSFTYYTGQGSPLPGTTDPQVGAPIEFYRYLSGSWRDGTAFTFGGNGYNPGSTDLIEYAFPNEPTDQAGWSMCTAALPNGDRRTVQASGPFRLDPGAVNELIIGAVWVADQLYPCPDLSELYAADDLAQALFNNCFKLPDGPDAPDLDFIELDKELIMILTNDNTLSNNAFELYAEKGLNIPEGVDDSLYRFEGYKVFQLAGPNVNISDINDIEKSRIIFQVDKRNGVNSVYNWRKIPHPNPTSQNADIWVPEEKVMGADGGVEHTFSIKIDQFASENPALVNHKRYYYVAVAYGYNNYQEFEPFTSTRIGQQSPYLEGRNNVKIYNPLPHRPVYKKIEGIYGQEPKVTRLSGQGVGERFVEVDTTTMNAIANGTFDGAVGYNIGAAPIQVKVVNPLVSVDGTFILKFEDDDNDPDVLAENAQWRFYEESTPDIFVKSERSIADLNEQILKEFGISVFLGQSNEFADPSDPTYGVIGGSIIYDDPSANEWFTFISDNLGGAEIFDFVPTDEEEDPNFLDDPEQFMTNIAGGSFVPFLLVDYRATVDPAVNPAGFIINPGWIDGNGRLLRNFADLDEVRNVDIVFTDNKDHWSRCIVVEGASRFHVNAGLTAVGNRKQFELRDGLSVGKNVDSEGNPVPEFFDGEPEKGMGWFPGYAYDVETGERLNIFFAENSVYTQELEDLIGIGGNGADMIWNPDNELVFTPPGGGNIDPFSVKIGGGHYIYVMNTPYDSCKSMVTNLNPPTIGIRIAQTLKDVGWVSAALVANGDSLKTYEEGLIPDDMMVSLRVDNPYAMAESEGYPEFEEFPTYRIEYDSITSRSITEEEFPEALAAINVVPNPYYGYSEYENSQFSNVVKFTNLPAECNITIYSLDGRFIRQYKRNESGQVQSPPRNNPPIDETQVFPDLEWDIKNSKGIPVASGVYLIHVDAPGIGERILKWFGVNRRFDPSGL